MMKKQPEYTYERDSGVWAVVRWTPLPNGAGYSAAECQDMLRTMYINKGINWAAQDLAYCLLVWVEK